MSEKYFPEAYVVADYPNGNPPAGTTWLWRTPTGWAEKRSDGTIVPLISKPDLIPYANKDKELQDSLDRVWAELGQKRLPSLRYIRVYIGNRSPTSRAFTTDFWIVGTNDTIYPALEWRIINASNGSWVGRTANTTLEIPGNSVQWYEVEYIGLNDLNGLKSASVSGRTDFSSTTFRGIDVYTDRATIQNSFNLNAVGSCTWTPTAPIDFVRATNPDMKILDGATDTLDFNTINEQSYTRFGFTTAATLSNAPNGATNAFGEGTYTYRSRLSGITRVTISSTDKKLNGTWLKRRDAGVWGNWVNVTSSPAPQATLHDIADTEAIALPNASSKVFAHLEGGAGYSIDGATLTDGWEASIVNTTDDPQSFTFSNTLAFIRDGKSVQAATSPIIVPANSIYNLQHTLNGGASFLQIEKPPSTNYLTQQDLDAAIEAMYVESDRDPTDADDNNTHWRLWVSKKSDFLGNTAYKIWQRAGAGVALLVQSYPASLIKTEAELGVIQGQTANSKQLVQPWGTLSYTNRLLTTVADLSERNFYSLSNPLGVKSFTYQCFSDKNYHLTSLDATRDITDGTGSAEPLPFESANQNLVLKYVFTITFVDNREPVKFVVELNP